MTGVRRRPQAVLCTREVVTLGTLHALREVGNRAFYHWLAKDYRPLFPRLPERTRLFRLFKTYGAWTAVFMAAATLLGVIDTYGLVIIGRGTGQRHQRSSLSAEQLNEGCAQFIR